MRLVGRVRRLPEEKAKAIFWLGEGYWGLAGRAFLGGQRVAGVIAGRANVGKGG